MDSRAQPIPPAARQEGLLVEEIGKETVVYDVDTKEAHALSPVAAAVFAGSDGQRSLADLAAFAAERSAEPVTEDEVWDALVELERCNLLEPPTGGISRRGFVRAGATIAASAGFVTTLAMPAVAAVTSCPIGRACPNGDGDCASVMNPLCTGGDCNSCRCIGATPGHSVGFTGCTGSGKDEMCTGTVPAGQCGWA